MNQYELIGYLCMWVVIICFDSFGTQKTPKEIKKFMGSKNIITNIYIIQACNSVMLDSCALDLLLLSEMVDCSFTKYVVVGSNRVAVT